jgi:hypothetical protein
VLLKEQATIKALSCIRQADIRKPSLTEQVFCGVVLRMKIQLYPLTGVSLSIRLLAFLISLLAGLPEAKAQLHGQEYQLVLGINDFPHGTQNTGYNSGVVTNSILSTNITDVSQKLTVSASLMSDYQSLQYSSSSSMNYPTWDGNGKYGRASSPNATWVLRSFDRVSLTSPTLPGGTFVTVRFALLSTGYRTPNNIPSGGSGASCSASTWLRLWSTPYTSWTVPVGLITNLSFGTATIALGPSATIDFATEIWSASDTWANWEGFIGSVSLDVSTKLYIDYQIGGTNTTLVNGTSSSGTVYPTLGELYNTLPAPTLNIRYTNNSAIVWWPSVYSAYTLKQTSTLNPASWTSVTNPITVVGSDNQITVSPPVGTRYFRLER